MSKKLKRLIISVLLTQGAGLVGALSTAPAISSGWYEGLIKPKFTPPSWLFGPAWTTLYILMAVSLYLVWNKEEKEKRSAFITFGVQLLLNALWSFLFFRLRSPLLGLINIALLWVAILITILKFRKVSKKAAYLLFPYLWWVSFAFVLNFSIWQLNSLSRLPF